MDSDLRPADDGSRTGIPWGRLGVLMIGSKVLFIPGIILLIIGGTPEAGTVDAVRTVKMSTKLLAQGNRTDYKRHLAMIPTRMRRVYLF
jgi:hypothetical protein